MYVEHALFSYMNMQLILLVHILKYVLFYFKLFNYKNKNIAFFLFIHLKKMCDN